MSAPGTPFMAAVIGGGCAGLAAGAYLARAGVKTIVLEARETTGGQCTAVALEGGMRGPLAGDMVHALDQNVVRDLKLHDHGLRFASRDMPLVALRPGGRHMVLPREIFAGRTAVAVHTPADADAYMQFRRKLFALARRLRPFWFGVSVETAGIEAIAKACKLSDADTALVDILVRTGAAAYLDRWFESDALKAALAFDATGAGISSFEPGSALALVWRYAQESCGLQASVAQILGTAETLAVSLERAARAAGAEIRTNARVRSIQSRNGRVASIVLETGEEIEIRAALSTLSPRRTFLELVSATALGFERVSAVPAAAQVGTATLIFALHSTPPFAGLKGTAALRGRLIMAERPESAAEAKAAAVAGRLPAELILEAHVPSVADPNLAPRGSHVLVVQAPLVPARPAEGWEVLRETLRKRVIAHLEAYAPGIKDRILGIHMFTPEDMTALFGDEPDITPVAERLLTPYGRRLATPLKGLYLCGGEAEPLPALALRAARLAAGLAAKEVSGHG